MPITAGQGNPTWTHDETILALELYLRHRPQMPGPLDASVIELSETLNRLPVHPTAVRGDSFRNPEGVAMKLLNLRACDPTRSGKGLRASATDQAVWDELADNYPRVHSMSLAIRDGAALLLNPPPVDVADETDYATEGAVMLRVHRIRERQKGLRGKLIAHVQSRDGAMACEACGWCAAKGSAAAAHSVSALEAHHIQPLAMAAQRRTRVADLVLLCATCHRLIHAAIRETGEAVNLSDFKGWISS